MADRTPADRAHPHPLALVPLPDQDQITTPDSVPLTSFFGRETEIGALTALLLRPEVRLLTLTGPGGIGKTRLARRVMETVRDAHPDEVAWVSLAPVRDLALVLPTLAQTLDMSELPGQPLLEQVTAVQMERNLLLVLDNLEHLLNAVAPLVARLLASCPGLTVLTTSRGRLNISGEQVIPVAPLDPKTAHTLFAVRAQASDPAFAVTPETAPVVDAICERLDRLPLAIELAAARTAVLSPHALLGRLEHRLDLLTGGPRDAPARLRDMRDTIAWSHNLLAEPEQLLFRRLGLFVGGFTLEAAQAVAGEGADVLTGVSALVAASLVIHIPGVKDEQRFTMLETIRAYALEQLAARGDEAAIRRAHAQHLVALAEQQWAAPTGHESEQWLRRLGPELGNIRSALAWALAQDPVTAARLAGALGSFWLFHGDLTEGRAWTELALTGAPDLPAPIQGRALATVGWLAKDLGDLVHADAYLSESAAIARAVADDRLLLRAVGLLGEVVLARGDVERAWQLLADGQAAAERTGDPLAMALAKVHLGRFATLMGDLPRAQTYLEDAVVAHQRSGGTLGVAVAQSFLGDVLLARGDEAHAAIQYRAALHGFADIAAWGPAGSMLEGIAAAAVRHSPETAAHLLGAAAGLFERVGDFQRSPDEAVVHARAVHQARTALGEPAFSTDLEKGTQLAWEELLAEVDTLVDAITGLPEPFPMPDDRHGLSLREQEVLRLVAEGASNRAISEALSLSERTVENHVRHILDKLELDSRVAAATWAVRHDLA